jgi:hypothetical protein
MKKILFVTIATLSLTEAQRRPPPQPTPKPHKDCSTWGFSNLCEGSTCLIDSVCESKTCKKMKCAKKEHKPIPIDECST